MRKKRLILQKNKKYFAVGRVYTAAAVIETKRIRKPPGVNGRMSVRQNGHLRLAVFIFQESTDFV